MSSYARILFLLLLVQPAPVQGEVLVRWDLDQVPARESLGVSTLLIRVDRTAAIEDALAKGYRVYVELDSGTPAKLPALERLSGVVVSGSASPKQLAGLKQRLAIPPAHIRSTEDRGKWPHVRLNWVTSEDDVLQVSSRTSQPWLENNGALIRIAQTERHGVAPLLAYPWTPITISDVHQGPALENYLVAIAEAGSFGSDLVLLAAPRDHAAIVSPSIPDGSYPHQSRGIASVTSQMIDVTRTYSVVTATAGQLVRWPTAR
jgi:hypothetical protein